MQTDFQILLSVKVAHTYFENDRCNCLQFSPDADSAGMFKKFGFFIKYKINGFDLYSNSAAPITALLDYMKTTGSQDYFKFDILNTNTNFRIFTELPVDRLWQMDYSSHDPLNSIEGDDTILHLTLTDQKTTHFIGSLKLYFTDIIFLSRKISPVNFSICLNSRTTQWQYYIINKGGLPLNNPSISSSDNIVFNGPENVLLENGEAAILFYTDGTGLPLSEFPTRKLSLVNSVTGSTAGTFEKKSVTRKIIQALPMPKPSNFGILVVDGKKQVTSPMYIYL